MPVSQHEELLLSLTSKDAARLVSGTWGLGGRGQVGARFWGRVGLQGSGCDTARHSASGDG
jgi:hypothetical protein